MKNLWELILSNRL